MQKRIFSGFLICLFVFVGCTPLSESVLKKGQADDVQVRPREASDAYRVFAPIPDDLLDPLTRNIVKSYGATIKKYSNKYGFDWRLILAIMKQESGFSAIAESHKGAQGLMQIMPTTGEELARVLEIEDITHPRSNIRGGVFYLRRLYNMFESAEESDRIKLSLAAYNAGIGRVYDAQELAAYFREDPNKWQAVRDALPLLSKRYYTLHKNVWPQEKPRAAGFFGNSRETIAYVEKIMAYYDEYRLMLN